MKSHAKEIEQFCREFLLDNGYRHIHDIIGEYDERMSCIDISSFTAHNFDRSFQMVCRSLFAVRAASTAYIVAVLGFAVNVDRRLKEDGANSASSSSSSWYNPDIMIVSLVSALARVNFNPEQLKGYTFCTLI